jgi:hypothetical protein
MQVVYVAATGQNVGKTTVAMGLVHHLVEQGLSVRFFKPVGQHSVAQGGVKVDHDAVLMQSAFSLPGELTDINPLAVPQGFIEDYILNRDPEPLRACILDSYQRLCEGCDVMVVEGTGHAGVGASIDLSNAEVAAMLGAKVLLVIEGGVGATLDQTALNLVMYKARNVDVLGVVANKVPADDLKEQTSLLTQGVRNLGYRLLGAIPFEAQFTYPRVRQAAEVLQAEILCGQDSLDRRVNFILIAAMGPQNVLPRLEPRTLMITPGDRVDNILVALFAAPTCADDLTCVRTRHRTGLVACVTGLILTCGLIPHFTIVALLKNSNLPVLLCNGSTYEVSSRLQSVVFKTLPEDTDRIRRTRDLVRDHMDMDRLWACTQVASV